MNGQGAANTQEQQKTNPETKPFPMDDSSALFDGGEWGIDFDPETGHIRIGSSEQAKAPETPGIAGATDENTEETPVESAASQQSGGKSPADERIAKLEGVVTQLINVVTQMAASPGQGNQDSNSLKEEQYDLSDQGQLSHFIGQSINKALKPIMDILPKIVQRIEHQDSRAAYGKDHDEALSHFRELVDGGALTARQAVELYQKIKGTNGKQSANTHGTDQQPVQKQQGTAEALISKANRVQTQTGINGSVPSNAKPIENVRDAFEAAIASLS